MKHSRCECLSKGRDQTKCRMYIDYQEDDNCALVAVEKNGSMTLREISERLNLSYVRIKQIQDAAILKFKKIANWDFNEYQ